ncbi:MAG: bifunctional riboflavin kinase/FAD synthetase [Rhizobiaceae bacterium]|nr:bifunctional riboflavin kinase/FAD synthetase [Rhizobiaceae bacterium]
MSRAFQRIKGSNGLPDDLRNGVVAIGNFDGVHRGHQSVLQRALDIGRAKGEPVLALVFEPHPRSFFRPQEPIFRLTPAPMRATLLEAFGLDGVVELAFTRDVAATEPEDFVSRILVADLGVRDVVTGYDFHFGRARRGDPAFLSAAGVGAGFGVSTVEAFDDEGGGAVSSTRIRSLLSAGEPAEAAALLGYRFTLEAEVGRGKQLGRTLGFPTANMALSDSVDLQHGIYAVRFRRADGSLHDGVASFGRRPTVEEGGAVLLETFLFDFDGDLYGETGRVSFFGFLRPELKFDGLAALTAQMRQDEAEARALLAGVSPLSLLDAKIAFAAR